MRLLVIEDDPDLNRQLATALTDAGYVVDRAFDGEEGHYLGETEPYDAVILDIGLPKMDGISVLESWRRAGRATPVLMLTARDRWSDKVQGFDAGADDYVAKPFHLEEVLARVRALLRRSVGHAKSEFLCGPGRLDSRPARRTARGTAPRPRACAPRGRAREERVPVRPGAARLAHRPRDRRRHARQAHVARVPAARLPDASHRPRGVAHRAGRTPL